MNMSFLGIEHNIHGHGLFQDSSINGHDYLRNIVHLPFFLQSQAMPPPPRSMYSREREESICEANHSGHGFAKYSVSTADGCGQRYIYVQGFVLVLFWGWNY